MRLKALAFVLRPKPVTWYRRWRTVRRLAEMERAGEFIPNAITLVRRAWRRRQRKIRQIRLLKWLGATLLGGLLVKLLR